jgi:D-3-phosphoglycerate dehydrogenase
VDILITENVDGAGLERLKQRFIIHKDDNLWNNKTMLLELLPKARAVIIRNQTHVDKNFIESAKELKVIGRAGIGYDNIDVNAASERGIVVCYTPEENTLSTAEHTFALILSLLRKLPLANSSTKQGNWNRMEFMGSELYNKSIGILGLGRIGFRVALRARAFGMSVQAHDKYLTSNDFVVTESGAKLMSMEDLLSTSDVVTNHLPLTLETKKLLDSTKFKLMKQDAVFVNTGRGETIVEKDLIDALKNGIFAGAALDVREKEPPISNGLNVMENVILTPHIAGLTHEAQHKVVESLARDVELILDDKPAINYVNFPSPT